MRRSFWPITWNIHGNRRYCATWTPDRGLNSGPASTSRNPRNERHGSVARLAVVDVKVVGYRESAGDGVRPNAGSILVRFPRHRSFQSHASVIHDDVNRRHAAQSVRLQT